MFFTPRPLRAFTSLRLWQDPLKKILQCAPQGRGLFSICEEQTPTVSFPSSSRCNTVTCAETAPAYPPSCYFLGRPQSWASAAGFLQHPTHFLVELQQSTVCGPLQKPGRCPLREPPQQRGAGQPARHILLQRPNREQADCGGGQHNVPLGAPCRANCAKPSGMHVNKDRG